MSQSDMIERTRIEPARPRRRPWLALVAVCIGIGMVGLDGTAVTIASPHIAETTGASLGDLQWVANAYLIALAAGLLPAGRLADRIGRRRTFTIGVVGFGVTSLAIALSTDVTVLILFRALQGIAGALLHPAALALVRSVFPPGRLGAALGVWGGANALAIGLGPVVAGVIIQASGWPAVFLLNVPIAALTVVLIYLAVGESKGPGGGLLGPLLQLIRIRAVIVPASVLILSSFAVFGLLFLLTLYLQNVHEFAAITAGLWLLTPIAVVAISAPLSGMLTQRYGPRWPVIAGVVLMVAGLLGLAQLTTDSGFGELVRPALLVGFGTGMCAVAATQSIMGAAPDSMTGMASAIQQTASQIGGILGIGLMGWMMTTRVNSTLPDRITEAGLSQGLGTELRMGVSEVTQGVVPETSAPDSGPIAGAVRAVVQIVFVDGMGVAFLLATAVIALGVPLAMMLRRRVVESAEEPLGTEKGEPEPETP
ncbi:putative MFS family arabinose efflux permease [Tamaricihabitans halophyticus]|uniref:Putative MFS family arabinose efflux permease n=1 Tax=Tamaricihabitans halophyticus TaxID=1262583 RepID=A0A4V2SSI3_9PSEU|nr:MFS transporter [Tamaricihabitans halophyticus]TCP46856.1 putative MFS family arabinose efflux permease [Tamaricihabitans halophyticus]